MGNIRKNRPKKQQRPKIDYPPVPTRKWIPPDKRPKPPKPEPPYQKPKDVTVKLKISSLKKIWNQFEILQDVSILLGHFSQTHKRFTFKSNGNQGACNCAVACIFAHLFKLSQWNRYYLDRILNLGDQLYLKTIQQPGDTCLVDVPPKKVYNSFFMGKLKISFVINDESKIIGNIFSIAEQKIKDAFNEPLEKFFKNCSSGIFLLGDKCLAIWIQDNAYYLFDPTEHQENGDPWKGIPGWGYSIVYRCKMLTELINQIYKNIPISSPNVHFEIYECAIQRVLKIEVNPPATFEEIRPIDTEGAAVIEDETPEHPAVNVVESICQMFIDQEQEVTSLKTKIEELSPVVTDSKTKVEKRPSWLEEGPVGKFDKCSKYPIPTINLPPKISYYNEIIPEKIGILRGTTCQTDTRLSKYEGRQSMGNAISALIMLRLYKSADWVPKIINTVLRNGDLLYRNAMVSIPRTQSLKLSDFQRKTEYEGKFFLPVIEEYSQVGKLQSQDYDVLDLLPALENFLTDNICCVIVGPVTLAVWIEDEHFYMFDPNERDKEGKAVQKVVTFDGNMVPTNLAPGSACVIWFNDLKDLVNLYMANVDKSEKENSFYLSRVKIDYYVDIPDNWYNFKALEPGKWILRGTLSQSNKKFPTFSRNCQSPCNCMVALAFRGLIPLKEWESATLDEVLDYGNKFYQDSVKFLQESDKFENRFLMLSEILKKYRLKDKQVQFIIDECFINGVVNANENSVSDLNKGLRQFFEDNTSTILTCCNISMALWKCEQYYYCFDGHDRNEKGIVTGFGTACVTRFIDVEDLCNLIETNLGPSKENFYNINRITTQFFEFGNGDTIEPPLNHYKFVDTGKAILRSLFSEISPKYDINAGNQTIPMCMTALAFNRLKPSAEWSKTDLDEILNKGDKLYVQTMNELQEKEQINKIEAITDETGENEEPTDADAPTEIAEAEPNDGSGDSLPSQSFRIRSDNVKKEFQIGLNNFQVEFEDIQEGNINQNLIKSIKDALTKSEQTKEGFPCEELLLESKPLSVAIWKDENRFYYFDSKPRDKKGYAVNIEQWLDSSELTKPAKKILVKKAVTLPTNNKFKDDDEKDMSQAQKTVKIKDADEGADMETEKITNIIELENLPEGEAATVSFFRKHEDEEEGYAEEEDFLERKYPLIEKTSSYWLERAKAGKACTMWFTKVEDLADHIFKNIPIWEAKTNDFVLKSVKMKNIVQLKDKFRADQERKDMYQGDWYSFKEVDYGKWILRGTMTIFSELFPESNRGRQLLPTCYAALAIVRIFGMLCFNNQTVDSILSYGDKLLTYVKKMRREQILQNNPKNLLSGEIDWLLENEEFQIGDVPNQICISKFLVTIEVEPEVVVGDIKAQNFEDVVDVHRGLETFFETRKYGIMQAKGLSVAVWKGQKMFFMFDGLSRGPNGISSPYGTACVLRYLDIGTLADDFLKNLSEYGKNMFVIHDVNMSKQLCPRERQPKVVKDLSPTVRQGGFQNIVPGKSIVCGSITQENPKFGKEPSELSAPIAVIALAMTLLHKTKTWSRPVIDDIIELGNELYEESKAYMVDEFDPWEDKIDLDKVKKDFSIGLIKANFDLRLTTQSGIFNSKRSPVPCLRKCIEDFFEENTHGILVSDPITLAIWEETNSDPTIYIFDPNPRSPTGMPLFTGTACLVSFVNSNMAADHIISCINQPELKSSSFTIFPVEIVVGNQRTPRKVKKIPTRSETNVLPRCSKLVSNKEKRLLRQIAADEHKKRDIKKINELGRKGFYSLPHGDAVLRGYRVLKFDTSNNPDICHCVVAIVMHNLLSVDKWKSKHIDLILEIGDHLYIDSYISYGPKDKKLGLENIIRKFYMNNLTVHVTIYKPVVSDMFIISSINNVLQVFFQQESCCVFSYMNQWVTLFARSGLFYMFDPHECNIRGDHVSKGELGSAALIRFDNLDNLVVKLFNNLFLPIESSARMFTLWLIDVNIKEQ